MKHQPLRYAHDEGHTDICFSSDGRKFITCGADGDIRIWSTVETEDPIHNCIGEWAVCVRQKEDQLFVATGNNDIQILRFPDGERISFLDRFVAPINHIAIAKKTNNIALAGEDMEVKLIKFSDEGDRETVIFSGCMGPCLSVALCPESKYLACTGGDGKLRIWDIEDKNIVKQIDGFPKTNSFANVKNLGRIDFDPLTGKWLAYPSNDTIIILDTKDWSEHTTLKVDEITSSYSIVQFSPCGQYIAASTLEGHIVIWNTKNFLLNDHSQHAKKLAITAFSWNPLGNHEIVYTDIEGQLGVMTECIKTEDVIDMFKDEMNGDEPMMAPEDDDEDEDNENVISIEKLKKQYIQEEEESEIGDIPVAATPRPQTPKIPLQTSFMPSSTPEHLNPRYLCWNDIGVIRSYNCNDDDSEKSIEVEFHDSSFHNSLMLQNFQNYFMGTISKSALIVANTNQISVIPLGFKEWTLKCEELEEIVLIASSENLVCFATNNYIVRVCSIFGTQRGIFSLPGPLVSMAAFKNCLLVAYHNAGVRVGDQCLAMKLIKFEGLSLQSVDITAALGPESTLLWLGFTDLGTPAMMDSLGMLSLYLNGCNSWIPFCDTTKHRKSPMDGFFVTAVFESNQTLVGIKCKGSAYPGFTPRPTVCELPLLPPFAESETEKSQMEMNLFAWSNLQITGVEKKMKEMGLKLFALACRNDFNERAFEFIEMLSNPQLLNLAVKYATKLDKKRLAENLMNLASKIMEEDPRSISDENKVETVSKVNKHVTLSKLSAKRKHNELKEIKEQIFQNSQEDSSLADISINSNISMNSELTQEKPSNPFLKGKRAVEKTDENPLSLTNRTAGVDVISSKENRKRNIEVSEKRKQPETESERPKEKQRRLEKFMFNKQS